MSKTTATATEVVHALLWLVREVPPVEVIWMMYRGATPSLGDCDDNVQLLEREGLDALWQRIGERQREMLIASAVWEYDRRHPHVTA